ncbi:aldo/keto reductase [bacterium]|nr:aldo/keto reductase [bacterium]
MRLPRLSPDKPDIDQATVKKMIDRAMKAGCNYFDTAYMYHDGLSERCLGELLQAYPRDSYYLTDKMPVWFAKNPGDIERIFGEQLARCKTDYFDFYMLHALDTANWKLAQTYEACEFLARMKKEGKIRKLGFSFHDTPEVLQQIVDAQEWDFAQIQLNYLDWELYRSREQYEILTKAGIPVIVMEPLRGGSLATLSPDAAEILKTADPGSSNAAWALRYVASLPNVLCVLSGMTLPEHMEDNLKTFSPLKPLTDSERKTLDLALAAYRKRLAVPCTACRYCMPCPVGVEIPRIFGLYNQYKITGNKWLFLNNYNAIPEDSGASACVNCGRCVKHCPQKIDIPAQLKKIAAEIA